MRVIILTSSIHGIAAYATQLIHNEPAISIAKVIVNDGIPVNKKHYLKKINKMLRIGLLGALNGIRMRSWFSTEAEKYLPPGDLETICKENNIEFHRTPSINCDITRQLFKEANADLGISLGNSYIARSVFSIPHLGMINIHGEILPDYQNAQSIVWQLHNNSAETGYTIHKINKNIDQGDILYKQKFPIIFRKTLKDTVAYNCAEIAKNACAGLVEVLKNYSFYNEKSVPQGAGKTYTTPSISQFYRINKNFLSLKNKNTNTTQDV